LKRQFGSPFLSIENKITSYKTLVRPVLACGSETWVLSKCDETILEVSERKILRVIFGPTNDNGEWRIKYSSQLYTLYKESDTVTYIEINRLKWAGRAIRMEEQSDTRRVLVVAVVEGRRQRGRPKLRWEDGVMGDGVMGDGVMGDGVMGDGVMGDGVMGDGVMGDVRKLGERNWRNGARNRDSWQKLLKKTLAQKGLLC
jgi:hypothetical protein